MSRRDPLSQRAHWSAGQPISYLMHLALQRPQLISLAAGFVDQHSLPAEATIQAIDALMSDPAAAGSALQYGTTHGFMPLRETILRRLLEMDGVGGSRPALDQVVLTAGSNELLHLVADTILDPGDIVLAGAPNYFVFLGMLGNLGARCIALATDEHGLVPAALDAALQRLHSKGELNRVKAVYITSYFDNPTSVSVAAQRRPQIVSIVKRHSAEGTIFILEDTAYRELRYAGDDVPSLRAYDDEGDTVVCTGTFSKSFSPGIRIGWGVLPRALVDPVLAGKGNINFGSPNFNQHLLAKVFELGLYEPHVEKLRETYRQKLAAMLAAADEHLAPIAGVRYRRPNGGLYVWLELPEHVDTGTEGELFRQALDAGVIYVPGRYCYPAEGVRPQDNRIRLSFGVQSAANIRRGVEALAGAIRAVV
ncbi:MAG: PLP-dependent aminotransferase family protein [Pirellulales bacterium]